MYTIYMYRKLLSGCNEIRRVVVRFGDIAFTPLVNNLLIIGWFAISKMFVGCAVEA